MDEVDLGILREMFIDRIVRFGGGDPRRSEAEIGKRTGVSHTAVGNRLRTWVRRGFFQGFVGFPNPRLLGLGFYGFQVTSESLQAREAIRSMLPRLPRIVTSWDQGGGNFWLNFLDRGPASAQRAAAELTRVPRVSIEQAVAAIELPECAPSLSPSEWKIVEASRTSFRVDPGALARATHLSPRTTRRLVDRLIESRSLMFHPRLDNSRAPGVLAGVRVNLDDASDAASIWQVLQRIWPVLLPIASWKGRDLCWKPPELPNGPPFLVCFVSALSPAEAVEKAAALSSVDGCAEFEVFFPLQIGVYPETMDAAVDRFRNGTTDAVARSPRVGRSWAHTSHSHS